VSDFTVGAFLAGQELPAEERSVLGVTDDVMNRLVQNYRSLPSVQNSLSGALGMSSYF
jgi:hypothetical protein